MTSTTTTIAARNDVSEAREDQRLMVLIVAEDMIAFGELYDRYCGRAYRVARAVCRDDSRAQDAVQEAFLSLWRTRTTYQAQRGSVAAWVLTVVRHRAIDIARHNSKHAANEAPEEPIAHIPAARNVTDHIVARDEALRIRTLLAQLPDSQREAITLAFYGELTHTEIAARLDLPTGTVKGRMRLGLAKLRTALENVA